MQAPGIARVVNPVSLKVRCSLPSRAVGVRSSRSMTGSTAAKPSLLFRQLFEKESSTYTYLLADVAHPDRPAVVSLIIYLRMLSCLVLFLLFLIRGQSRSLAAAILTFESL